MGNGVVQLIGAGPGDKKLMTVKAVECLAQAEVIVYDRLLGEAILQYANPDAELIYVGKGPGCHWATQAQINAILIEKALTGKRVARVKGGDPFVFGRGGEEAEALVERGIAFQIVPGISSAVAVPAYAGIPVTHRDYCSSFHVITGHEDPDKTDGQLNYEQLAVLDGTLIFLMGVGNLAAITANLIRHGKAPATPAAIIQNGTSVAQRVLVAPLAELAETAAKAGIGSPAVIVIGPVVALREKLNWFPHGPLAGKRILVTRAREQASKLVRLIEELGGIALEYPMIKVVAADGADQTEFRNAAARLAEFSWVVFTSANGVDYFFRLLQEEQVDRRQLAGLKFAVNGAATAQALWQYGFKADLIPSEYTATALLGAMLARLNGADRVLLIRAKQASEELVQGLTAAGIACAAVAAYQTVADENAAVAFRANLPKDGFDIITFTSSSTVRHFLNLLGGTRPAWLERSKVVAIGPVTTQTALEMGLKVAATAETHTVEGLIATILELVNQ